MNNVINPPQQPYYQRGAPQHQQQPQVTSSNNGALVNINTKPNMNQQIINNFQLNQNAFSRQQNQQQTLVQAQFHTYNTNAQQQLSNPAQDLQSQEYQQVKLIKPKAGLQRKGHQVSQSATFKNMQSAKHVVMVNKSYDFENNNAIPNQPVNKNNIGMEGEQQQTLSPNLNQSSKMPQLSRNAGGAGAQQLVPTQNQQFNTLQPGMNMTPYLPQRNLSQGLMMIPNQTANGGPQQAHHRKQQSFNGDSLSNQRPLVQPAATNHIHQFSQKMKPQSNTNLPSQQPRSTSYENNPKQHQQPQRIISSQSKKRQQHSQEFAPGSLQQIQESMHQRRLLESNQKTPAITQNALGQTLPRPKTSFGPQALIQTAQKQAQVQQNNTNTTNISYLDKLLSQQQQIQDDSRNNQQHFATIQGGGGNSQQQQISFITKKSAQNAADSGLRNFLRKSLDVKASDGLQQRTFDHTTTVASQHQQDQLLMKKRRDHSKVVGNGNPVPPLNQVIQDLYAASNSSNHKSKPILQRNVIVKQTNQPPQGSKQQAHQRSLTSHKINRMAMINQASGTNPDTETAAQDGSQVVEQQQMPTSPPQGTQKTTTNEDNNSNVGVKRTKAINQASNQALRASISKEVVTNQPQQTNAAAKFDNCVSKFAFATKTGFQPSNPNKVNQDSFLALPHLAEYRRTHFFAVCDGHGLYGKEVSEFIKSQLASNVEREIKGIFDQAKHQQRVVDSNEVKDALAKSFEITNRALYNDSGIDIYFSGSTCVTVLIVGNKIFCANVGDSRAVLARETSTEPVTGNKILSGYPLNRDHKANEPDEEARILSRGGRVEAFKDQAGRYVGPQRVWHLNENIPGLAMSRSFGDHCAAQVGCIAEPEVLEMNLSESDKFIVIASDGVWEFLSNDEVVRIVEPFYYQNSAEKAAEALIREALKRWKQEENVVDDITCIIIYLSIQ